MADKIRNMISCFNNMQRRTKAEIEVRELVLTFLREMHEPEKCDIENCFLCAEYFGDEINDHDVHT